MPNRKPIKTEITSFAKKIKLEDNDFEQIIFAVYNLFLISLRSIKNKFGQTVLICTYKLTTN